jgi:hypothetical protein
LSFYIKHSKYSSSNKTQFTFCLWKVFAAIVIACVFGGYISLYGTLVCVACSQLQKLKLALLDIRRTHVMSGRDCGDVTHQQAAEEQTLVSQDLFLHMRKKLNNCIRHHQEIKRYAYHRRCKLNYLELHIVPEEFFISLYISAHTGSCKPLKKAGT